jgi:glutamate dehydrogenase
MDVDFNGYHVRFRDIARGGLRLVTPSTSEQYALESARHYDQCYGLALAQQLKNKDIPEGGSKAVVLIQSYGLSDAGKALVKTEIGQGNDRCDIRFNC